MRRRVIALLAGLATAAPALAEEASPSAMPVASPAPPGRFFVHLNLGVNLYTHLGAVSPGATGAGAAADLTPDKRTLLLQLVGFGYWVHPQIRVALTLQFVETLSGIDTSKVSPFTTFAIIPWAAWTSKVGFFAGAGPLLAPRSYGDWSKFDLGLFTCAGWAFKLGHGVLLGAVVQVPLMFRQRFSVAVTPAITLGYRF